MTILRYLYVKYHKCGCYRKSIEITDQTTYILRCMQHTKLFGFRKEIMIFNKFCQKYYHSDKVLIVNYIVKITRLLFLLIQKTEL